MGGGHSRQNEVLIKSSSIHPIPLSISTNFKSFCKIEYRDKIFSGFLIKFFKRTKDFFCLMTNEHAITKEMIKQRRTITLFYDCEAKIKEIDLFSDKRYIKDFRDINMDIVVVEIIPQDGISKDYFLIPSVNFMYNYHSLKNKEIIILQYPYGQLSYSVGKIKEINENEFTHLASTEEGSSGSPVFLKENFQIIGIHKSGIKSMQENFGNFIGPIFKYFKNFGKNNISPEKKYEEKGKIKKSLIKISSKDIKLNNPNKRNFKNNINNILINDTSKNFSLSNSEEKIDTNLYLNQIKAFGMETMYKIIKMKILIIGMRGLGVETAKNIILIGPLVVQIFDQQLVRINDLCGNFYLTEADVGKKRRDEASLSQLSELNPNVHVSIMQGDLMSNITKFNVIVITEVMNKEKLIEIDEICRKNKIVFIYSSILGLSGFIFDDFGIKHNILDENGEECKTYFIETIEKNGCVTVYDDDLGGKVELDAGDYVKFREVGGMTQLNDGKPRRIKIISRNSFKIEGEDFSKYPEYTFGGLVEQVKVPKKMNNKSLKERFINFFDDHPIEPLDLSKVGRNELLFISFLAIHEFFSKNNSLPELNNKIQAEKIVKRTKEIYDENLKLSKEGKLNWFKGVQNWTEKIPFQIASWAKAEISPVCSFLGGVVAQEIVKYTGKYTPINQWLLFDFFETVANLSDKVDRSLKNGRYDDQIAIYGNEIQKKIGDSNIFMIGAGALGCEFLKNFALMGMSTKEGKKLIVTDNDDIEKSNLNRQFLFRERNIGQSKSKCACSAAKKMNPSFNTESFMSLVDPVNEDIFNEKFWDDQTYIINAVDNVESIKYIDNKCTLYGKCLIDSGTLGTKAHAQMIIPHVTSCYNDSQDPQEEGFLLTTIHLFPFCIEHCIEWGRDHFDKYFVDIVNETKKFLENRENFYFNLKREGNTTFQLTKLKLIKQHVILATEKNIDKIIEFSVMQYTENFDHGIRQLLYNYPEDYDVYDGYKLWSGVKRLPHPIPYDAKESLAFMFVKNYSTILSRALSIKDDLSDAHIKEVSSKVKIPPFVPKISRKKLNYKENNDQKKEEAELFSLMKELNIYGKKMADPDKIIPEHFRKNDYSNSHIDFIHACSNLRAKNYNIQECDKLKTKLIVGKVMPAIITTTAAITGIVSLQLYTLYQTNKIEFMRDCFFNLAINSILMSEPKRVIQMKDIDNHPNYLEPVKYIPPNWTVWDKIVINKSMTCQELIDYINEKYEVKVSIITSGPVTIIQTFMHSSKQRLNQKIEDIYNNNVNPKFKLDKNTKHLFLEISGDIGETIALMPFFSYEIKN